MSHEFDKFTRTEPVSVAARIGSLDVLRGFALLGILLLNIQDFASPASIVHDIPLPTLGQHAPGRRLDEFVMALQWLLAEGKMRALFSALFGAGTILLLDRVGQRNGEGCAADIFHRRCLWLMLFGLIHGLLIWSGDILLCYAICASLLLYPLRNVAAKSLIVSGLAISLLGGTLGWGNLTNAFTSFRASHQQLNVHEALRMHVPLTLEEHRILDAQTLEREQELAAVAPAVAAGRVSYLAGIRNNAAAYLDFWILIVRSGAIFEVIGYLVLGMGLFRIGFFSARWSTRSYAIVAVIGYTFCFTVVLIGLSHARSVGFAEASTAVWVFLPYVWQQSAGMLANAALLLLVIREKKLLGIQKGLAAIGRTAFSNYILTSLACQFLFRWGPWKLYGSLRYYQQLYVVAGVWALNLIFSILWLRVFAFGPLEWVWRSLTYWRAQPFLRIKEGNMRETLAFNPHN